MYSAYRNDVKLQRVAAFAQLGDETWGELSNRNTRRYFGVDTVFTLDPDSDLAWDWIRCRQNSNVSSATLLLGRHTFPHRVHRLVLARLPASIEHPFKRRKFQNRLRLFLHMHMRDGAVVYVAFVDQTWPRYKLIQAQMNFALLCDGGASQMGRLYRLPNLWRSRFEGIAEVTGGQLALEYCSSFWDAVGAEHPLAVWYEPDMFNSRRPRSTALWENMRRLVYRIEDGVCQGPSCRRSTRWRDGEVDHVVALRGARKSNSLLLNLSWLCKECNRRKSKIDTYEHPFVDGLTMIPEGLDDSLTKEAFGETEPSWCINFHGKPTLITSVLEL